MDKKKIKVFGVPSSEGVTPSNFFYYCTDMLYVSTYKPKKNYKVPQVFTAQDNYGPALTMKQCKEGLPKHFEYLVNGSIINLKKVAQIKKTQVGAQFIFNVNIDPIKISDYAYESKPWLELLRTAKDDPEDDRWIPAVEFSEEHSQGSVKLIRLCDVVLIESCEPKANYYVPLYKCENESYVEAMTLQSYKLLFPKLFPLLNTNLVNIDQVESAQDLIFDVVVRFKNSSLTTSMAHKYKRHFPEFFKK